MQVRFGNLSIAQFEDKTGVKLSEDDKTWLNDHKIESANFTDADKFHIFDLPMGILAGSDIVHELIKRLRAYTFEKQFYVEELV